MGGERFGKYVVVRPLARSDAADVYEASDPALDRRVVVKVLHPPSSAGADFAARFRAEAKRLAALRHPNIAQLYDFDFADGHPFIVMEHLGGGTLRDRLSDLRRKGETMPPAEAARILDSLAAGLDYAHAQGIIHGDIKPANILFTSGGEPVLTDFGADVLSPRGPGGTAAYTSPEQGAGRPADARSDLYSLGVVLYEIAAGAVPFQGDSPATVLWQQQNAPPLPPRQLNPALSEASESAILRALAKSPADRFAGAGELAQAFRGAAPVSAPAPAPTKTGTSGAAAPASKHWVERLADAADAVSPLAGKKAPEVKEKPRDVRSWLAAIFGSLSVFFAAYQMLTQMYKAVVLPFAGIGKYLPYLILPLFLAAAGLALYAARRTSDGKKRKRAYVMFALIAAVGLVWGTWTAYNRLRPASEFVVAIADFDGSKASRRVDFSRRIYEQLARDLGSLGGSVEVVRTGEVYDDSESARAHGEARKATIVIWGWYDDAGVSPRVEAMQIPSLKRESISMPLLAQSLTNAISGGLAGTRPPGIADVSRYVREPASMADYDVFVKDGPQQMSYISASILGLAFYVNGDDERALAMFDKALASAPAGASDIVGQHAVFFQRSVVLFKQDRLDQAVADLEQALAFKADFYEAHHNLAIALAETCSPDRQLQRAIAEADAAMRLEPDSAEARRLLGDLYRQAGRYDEALAQLQVAARLEPDNAANHELLADAQSTLGQTDAAQSSRETAVTLRSTAAEGKPSDPVGANLSLGDAYVAAGNYDRALEAYRAAQTLAPDDPRIHWALGNAHYWGGNVAEAEKEYAAWAQAAPKDGNAHLLLGILYQEQGKTEQAVAELKQAASLFECDPSAYLILAGLYYNGEDYAGATDEMRKAVAIEPDNADSLYVLGNLLWLQDSLDEAVPLLEKAVALRPETAAAHFSLGQVYRDLGDYEKAAAERELAARYAPDEPDYFTALGNALWDLQKWDETEAAYQKSLALRDDATVRVWLGMTYHQQAKYDAAIAEYGKALALDANTMLAQWGLGDAYVQMGRLDDAAAAYQRALAMEDSAGLRSQLAAVYVQQGKPDAAIPEYEKAVALDPQGWSDMLRLGDLYLQAGRVDDAEAQYRSALAIQPNAAGARYGLAVAAYKRCNLSVMQQEMELAAGLAPGVSFYRGALAQVREAQGRAEEAAAIYAELLAAPADDPIAHVMAGSWLFRAGKLEEAAAQYQTALGAKGLVPAFAAAAHTALGNIFAAQGKPMPAESEYALALEALPAQANAQLALGDLALKAGDSSAALDAYDKAIALLPEYGQQVSADDAALLRISLEVRRSIALDRQGKKADAREALDKALVDAQGLSATLPRWPVAHYALGIVYGARGDNVMADAEFASAAQCDQSLVAARIRVEAELAALR